MCHSNPLDSIERARFHDLARNRAKALRRQAIESFWSDVLGHGAAAFQGLTRFVVTGVRQCTAHVVRRFRTASGI